MSDFPVHGANLAWAERSYGIPANDFLDFSSNVNPLGPPASVLEAAHEALRDIARYPEPQGDNLKVVLSSYLGVDTSGLMLGNGSSELIHLLCRVCRPGRVAIVAPAFGEYERAAAAAGAELSLFILEADDGFGVDPEEIAVTAAAAGITFFCNPASPHGRLYKREELLPALAACRAQGSLLVVDESFLGFCSPDEILSSTLLPEASAGGLVVISTLTKLFALAGLRGPGYCITHPELALRLEAAAAPWRVNVVAAAAAHAALAATSYTEKTRAIIPAWRAELRAALEALEIFRIFPSRANFLLLCSLAPGLPAGALADALGHRGILVRNCRNFTGLDDRYLRVAVRPPEESGELARELKKVIEAVGKSKG